MIGNHLYHFKNQIIESFGTFIQYLKGEPLDNVIIQVLHFFEKVIKSNQSDYIICRFIFAKLIVVLSKILRESFFRFYSHLFPSLMQSLSEANDSDQIQKEITHYSCLFLGLMVVPLNQAFVDADKFRIIIQAIMPHLGKTEEQANEYYEKITEDIAPAIANVYLLADDMILWKTANREILNLMSHESYEERIASLRIIRVLFKVIGPKMVPLIPELLPPFYELFEDPIQEVQFEVHSVKQDIEDSIGESLDSYK